MPNSATAPGDGLSPKQARFLDSLLVEASIAAAARAAGVPLRTAHRWLAGAAFRAALRQVRTLALEASLSRLATVSGSAVSALEAVLSGPETPAAVRVTAARAVLSISLEANGSLDLQARLAAVEELLADIEEPVGNGHRRVPA